jgi:multiple sugar transport system substrate-binding protein
MPALGRLSGHNPATGPLIAILGEIELKALNRILLIVLSIVLVTPALAGPKLNMLINQSPWFDGFRKTLEMYEAETGANIELDVTPYPAMSEKIRNSIRAPEGIYDIVITSTEFMSTHYDSGLLEDINKIDPDYKLDDGICSYQNTSHWNYDTHSFDPNGTFVGIPVNGNVQVLYYRRDLYEEKGLKPPKTWDDLIKNASVFHNPPAMYGMIQRSERSSVTYNFGPYLFSHGGSIYKDPVGGDWSIMFNSPQAKAAMEKYLELRDTAGHPNSHAVGQGEMIQYLRTGRAAHAIAVIAAWGGMDDPDKSAVVGKLAAALIPTGPTKHSSSLGHWEGSIPKNIPDENKVEALNFLKWLVTKENQIKYIENGAVPVRCDLINSPLAKEDQFRFLEALGQNSDVADFLAPLVKAVESTAITNLYLNKIVAGELSIADGLNQAADELHEMVTKAGLKSSKLPPLK